MFSKNEIESIINSYIESIEKPGERSGGSGHLGFVSYNLIDFYSKPLAGGIEQIVFKYILSVETEFNYYPDNPPTETTYEKMITIDNDKNVLSEETISVSADRANDELIDFEWEEAKNKITNFVVELLEKIEWTYGENRAPVKFPPIFDHAGNKYRCSIELEEGGGELTFESEDTEELTGKVIADLTKRFYPK